MAAHTTGDSGERNRKFQIGRENGQKTAPAVFLEWIPKLPDEPTQGRRFETRKNSAGESRFYETFKAIDGFLTGIYTTTRQIMGEDRTMLVVVLDDTVDVQEIEIGDVDGRYSLNLIERLLSPSIDFSKKIRLAPYAYTKNEKQVIGIGVHCGVDEVRRPENGSLNVAPAGKTEHKGKILYDFMPVFESLWTMVEKSVKPKLYNVNRPEQPAPAQRQPIAVNFPAEVDAAFPGEEPPAPEFDLLPF